MEEEEERGISFTALLCSSVFFYLCISFLCCKRRENKSFLKMAFSHERRERRKKSKKCLSLLVRFLSSRKLFFVR